MTNNKNDIIYSLSYIIYILLIVYFIIMFIETYIDKLIINLPPPPKTPFFQSSINDYKDDDEEEEMDEGEADEDDDGPREKSSATGGMFGTYEEQRLRNLAKRVGAQTEAEMDELRRNMEGKGKQRNRANMSFRFNVSSPCDSLLAVSYFFVRYPPRASLRHSFSA